MKQKDNCCQAEKTHGMPEKKKMRKKCRMLCDIAPGGRVCIRCHHSKGAVRQRLLDLGFVPSAEVNVVRNAPLGDPIQLRVSDYSVTLRRSEASMIEVVPC